MLLALFLCIFALGVPLDVLSIWMKMHVNKELPEEERLSWWSRNYWKVEDIYSEQHPDSVLPKISRYGGFLILALLAAAFLLGLSLNSEH
jgi:hypothetical protein